MKKLAIKKPKRLSRNDKPNLILHIKGIKCHVDINPMAYSEEEINRITNIINYMSKDIWLDKSYVCYKGNRWKDAFINEEKWYDLNRIILNTNFGRNAGKQTNKIIMNSLLILSITYLYQIVSKYNFDIDEITITFKKNMDFESEYFEDTRINWDF